MGVLFIVMFVIAAVACGLAGVMAFANAKSIMHEIFGILLLFAGGVSFGLGIITEVLYSVLKEVKASNELNLKRNKWLAQLERFLERFE